MKTDSRLFSSWHQQNKNFWLPSISTFWSSLSACLTWCHSRWLLSHIRTTRLVRRASDHSNLATISTLVRLRDYSYTPALRIEVQLLPQGVAFPRSSHGCGIAAPVE